MLAWALLPGAEVPFSLARSWRTRAWPWETGQCYARADHRCSLGRGRQAVVQPSGMDGFGVVVAAGSLRSSFPVAEFPHRWTPEGVTVDAAFTGAHLLHLAVAGCVLNDTYREAAALGVPLLGVRVGADGSFDEESWRSDGIRYWVEVDAQAEGAAVEALLRRVDEVAEIPKSVRAGAAVERVAAR